MLKKQHRLSSNFEFNVVKKYGSHLEGEFVHVYFLKPTNYTGETKMGIVVSNKYDKRSTKRNYVKRLFRESFRRNMEILGKDLWIVIYPKFNCTGVNYEKINSDLIKTLQKIPVTR